MKKRIIGLMVICLVIALTGCGKEATEQENQIGGIGAITSSSKVVKLMGGNYYMKYSGSLDGEEMNIEVTKKDGKIAARINAEEASMRAITDYEYVYTVMDDQKWYIKTTASKDDDIEDFDFGSDLDETKMTSGKETIDGVEYYYEEFDGVRFYFIKDDLKMIVAEDDKVIVEESSNKARDDIFDIPADYEELKL